MSTAHPTRRPSRPCSNIGIIGCGDLAQRTLLPCLLSAEGRARFKLVAVWSPLVSDRRAMQAQVPDVQVAAGLNALLQNPAVDTVWILGPADTHPAQVLAALAAGKHVYVQKPVAVALSGFDVILAATTRADRFVSAAPGVMTYPTIRLIRERLDARCLGPIYAVTAPFMGWGGRVIEWAHDPSWRFESGNGPLRDHGIYTLTILQTLLGPPRRVSALGGIRVPVRQWRKKSITVTEPDNFAILLEYESGVFVTLNEAWCAGGPGYHFRFHGLEGTLETEAGSFEACPRAFVIRDAHGTVQERVDATTRPEIAAFYATAPVNAHVWADVCELADCVAENREPVASPRNVRFVYVTMDAIYRSIREKRVIELGG